MAACVEWIRTFGQARTGIQGIQAANNLDLEGSSMKIKCCGSHVGGQERRHPGQFVGSEVEIRFGGGDCLVGRLVAICGDYLVLKTRHHHIVYVNARQVRSITELRCSHRSVGHVKFIRAHNFHGVIRELRLQFVKIDLGRADKVKGFISEVGPNQVLIVDDNQLTQIPIHQIRAISPVCQSRGHRSGGHRTGGHHTGGHRTGGHRSCGHRSGGSRVGGEFAAPCRNRTTGVGGQMTGGIGRTPGVGPVTTYSRKAGVSRAVRPLKRRSAKR
ncbi:hypothetical protein [Paenibacillus daejeonensis]|uniref:hypothetical protein n=1 Tax=Paenibacillus daejeonensis TaxID=135193 RepID=UPI0012FAB435|nr:hypothetical protein [Paenibacillus daejeonensis]